MSFRSLLSPVSSITEPLGILLVGLLATGAASAHHPQTGESEADAVTATLNNSSKSLGTKASYPAVPTVNCSSDYLIDVTLDSGARWTMCWEQRRREGIVFHDVTFTPPGGTPLLVLAQANPAQLHVPYDDNGARYYDETDYGLGGTDLATIETADCPNGSRLAYNARAVLCQQVLPRGYAIKWYADAQQGQLLHLFSVSHVGEYNYIFDYSFDDDGTMELAVGASGRLQRYTRSTEKGEKYGWPVHGHTYAVSHVHNYYWRLDFDLGGQVNQDVFQEIEFPPEDARRDTRLLTTQTFTTEIARPVSPTRFRSWRVYSNALSNSDGHAISYQLDPESSNVFHGPAYEPFTQNEVYATVNHPCERFVSHNPTIAGCGSNVTDYVNGETLTDADLVVWYGQAFHHLPHDEDEPRMDTHWSRFFLRPIGVTATNPLARRSQAGADEQP